MGNQKKKLLALLATFTALLIGEGAFAYYCFTERGQHNEALAKLQKEEDEAQAKIREIPSLSSKRQELATIIGEYAQILPREDEIRGDQFLEDVGRFAHESDVKIITGVPVKLKKDPRKARRDSAKVAAPKEDLNTFVRHAYRFELEGNFVSFMKFINRLENHTRFLRVDEIGIEPQKVQKGGEKQDYAERSENPVKKIELVISTYTYSKDTNEGEAK